MDEISRKVEVVRQKLMQIKSQIPYQRSRGCFMVCLKYTEGVIKSLEFFESVRKQLIETYKDLTFAGQIYPEVQKLNDEINEVADECQNSIHEIYELLEEDDG